MRRRLQIPSGTSGNGSSARRAGAIPCGSELPCSRNHLRSGIRLEQAQCVLVTPNVHHWRIVENATPEDLAVILEGVFQYGRALAVGGNARPVACLVSNEGVIPQAHQEEPSSIDCSSATFWSRPCSVAKARVPRCWRELSERREIVTALMQSLRHSTTTPRSSIKGWATLHCQSSRMSGRSVGIHCSSTSLQACCRSDA